jgi:hypothetical protein
VAAVARRKPSAGTIASRGRGRGCGVRSEPARRRAAGGTAAPRESAEADSRGETGAGGAREGRGHRHGPASRGGEAGLDSPIQLHRSGVADHERPRRLRPGLQRAGGGGRGAATDRGPRREAGEERQAAVAADDHRHRAAVGRHAHAVARRRGLLLGCELGGDRRHDHRRVHLERHSTTRPSLRIEMSSEFARFPVRRHTDRPSVT